jgi:hypothetical protein
MTGRGELQTGSGPFPLGDAVLDLGPVPLWPVAADACDDDTMIIGPLEILLQIGAAGASAWTRAWCGEGEDVVGVDNVLMDTG